MGCAFLVQRELTASLLTTVTSQAGLKLYQPLPATTNTGLLTMLAGGTPTAATALGVKLYGGGDLGDALIRFTADAWSTSMGRRVETGWDVSSNQIYDGSIVEPYGCGACAIDRDGDGYPDRILYAIVASTTIIKIYYTDDMSGAGTFTLLASEVVPSASGGLCSLAAAGGSVVYLSVANNNVIDIYKSVDGGATFSLVGPSVAAWRTAGSSNFHHLSLLPSGRLLIVYSNGTSYNDICCRTSRDGATWTGEKVIASGSTEDLITPWAITTAAGKTIVFYHKPSVGIAAKYTTSRNPAAAAATWSTETIWTTATTEKHPTATISPDGSIFVVVRTGSSSYDLKYSKQTKGTGSYAALSTVLSVTGNLTAPILHCFGGSLWCAYQDEDAYDIKLARTRFWGTYDGATYTNGWTGTSAQYLTNGIWITPGGRNGHVNDSWTLTPYYSKGGTRVLSASPSDSYRSLADNLSSAYLTIDKGSGKALEADAIALIGCNLDEAHWQMDDTDSFLTPVPDAEVSFRRSTGTVTAISAYVLTASAGVWTDHEFAVGGTWHVKMTSGSKSGYVYRIADNSGTRLFCLDDLTGVAATDTFAILAPSAYKEFAVAIERYNRISIPQQRTAEGYYEIGYLHVGRKFSPTINFQLSVRETYESTNEVRRLASGRKEVNALGAGPVRKWKMEFRAMPSADAVALIAMIRYAGVNAVPVCFVPDTAVPTDVLHGFITAVSEVARGSKDERTFSLEIEEEP